jgi:hypothetical protein
MHLFSCLVDWGKATSSIIGEEKDRWKVIFVDVVFHKRDNRNAVAMAWKSNTLIFISQYYQVSPGINGVAAWFCV